MEFVKVFLKYPDTEPEEIKLKGIHGEKQKLLFFKILKQGGTILKSVANSYYVDNRNLETTLNIWKEKRIIDHDFKYITLTPEAIDELEKNNYIHLNNDSKEQKKLK